LTLFPEIDNLLMHSSEGKAMGVKCPKCQHENPDDTLYCGKCATRLPSPEKAEVTETLETPKEELTTGSTFAHRYQIIEELGKGGMGKVYKALDKEINAKVALKLIKPEISADDKTIERFRNELRIARDVSHKNVCRMYDLNKEEGSYFITMEYVSGEDLRSFIRRSRQLAVGTAITIAKQVCEGLSEAHKSGVVHRDLKPSNIMIDKEGNARIMDFGIARSLKAKGITREGVTIGTPEYMSPEQVEAKETDQRTDIYSLGVILFEMVTGRRPFEGDTPLSIAVKQKTEPPPDPRDFNAQVPEVLTRVIHKCMEKDKESRYQSAGEVRSELMRIEEGIPTTERKVPKPEAPTSKEITERIGWSRWKRSIPFLGAVVLIALIAALFFFILPGGQDEIDSIAVLPMRNPSGDQEHEILAYGMTDALIKELGKVGSLSVTSHQSVMQYKGSTKPMPEIARELNVDGIVEGAVLLVGQRVQITAKLFEAKRDRQLWAEDYERDKSDVLSLQGEVAKAIVREIKAKVTPQEQERLGSVQEVDPEAYQLYQKGLYFFSKGTIEDLQNGLACFKQAQEIDPACALAYVGEAGYYFALGYYSLIPPKQAFPRVKELSQKALEIDETLAAAHSLLASTRLYYDWDWPAAEGGFKRAIELNPSYAGAHEGYSDYLSVMGRYDEALVEGKRALELDPRSLNIMTSFAGLFIPLRQYDRAIEEYRKVLDMDPDHQPARLWLALCYRRKGMYDKALAEVQNLLDRSGRSREGRGIIAGIYAVSGKTEEAKKLLGELIESSKQEYVSSWNIALVYSELGQKDQAFGWLEKAYTERSNWLVYLKSTPWMDSLRSDPRYTILLKKIGLE
jgi:serine/threonine protein kinase/tetratricopeptide (TPR) repeat protein